MEPEKQQQEQHSSAEWVETSSASPPTTTAMQPRHHPEDDEETGVPPGYWTSYRFLGSCVAIILLANNLFIGYAMPANILSIINEDIGPDPQIYLVTLLNTLIKGVGLLLVGSLSDVLGRRYFVVAGQALGFIGSIIAATSTQVPTIVGASVLQGMAGATQTLYPTLSQEIVPNKYRGLGQAVITATVFPTLGLGPAFARLMVENTQQGWRWCFWLNCITTGLSLILFLVCYFPPNAEQLQVREERRSKLETLKSIDFGGLFLYTGGLLCLLLALSWGGKQYPWSDAPVIATLVIGVVLLVLFFSYEIYMPLKMPLLPMRLFRIRDFSVAVVVGAVGQMSYYALNVLWPTHITALYTENNLKVGWMSCTTGAALAIGEVIAGPFCTRGFGLRWQLRAAVVLLTVFCGIMSMADETRMDLAIATTVLIGICVGWIELTAIVISGLVVPPENIGSGQSFFASTRAVMGTVATSIYLAIYNNRVEDLMPEDATEAEAKGVYAESFKAVYLSSLAFAGMALIAVCFATNVDAHFTNFLNKTVTAAAVDEQNKSEEDVEKVKDMDL